MLPLKRIRKFLPLFCLIILIAIRIDFIVEIPAGESLCYCKLKSNPSLPSPTEIFIPRMKLFIKMTFQANVIILSQQRRAHSQ